MLSRKYLNALVTLVMISLLIIGVACGGEENKNVDFTETGRYYVDSLDDGYVLSIDSDSFTLTLGGVSKTGTYTFNGQTLQFNFNDGSKGSAAFSDGTLNVAYNGSTYLFKKEVKYTVTFSTDGGSPVAGQSIIEGRKAIKPQDPQKDGHGFVAWYEDSAFNSAPFAFDAKPITKNTVLYARFEKTEAGQEEFEVKFVVDGSQAFTAKKTIGRILYNLPHPAKDGKVFVGWWVSDYQNAAKLTYQYTGQKLAANTTLFAVWKSDAPAVSVNAAGVNWTASVGVAYTLKITSVADGSSYSIDVSGGSANYNFLSRPAGDYVIEVTAKNSGLKTTAYYKNKTLDRVSLFKVVEPSILMFNAVAGAEKYLITIACGNDQHVHTAIDNGNSLSYYFGNCEMREGGIDFTVQAVAESFMTSVSDVFTFDRTLDEVTGLTLNEQVDEVVWNSVENAVSYKVRVLNDGQEYISDVGTATRYSLKQYSGEITVQVYPVARGYNSPQAAEIVYSKARISTPAGLRVTGTVVSWKAVDTAAGYNVKVGENVYSTLTNNYTLTTAQLAASAEYQISVQAVAETPANNSLYSDEINVKKNTMGALAYDRGTLSWQYVVDASRYVVRVNDTQSHQVGAGINTFAVPLTKAGLNKVEVCYFDAAEQQSAWSKIDVTAYSMEFDSLGGDEVDALYKANGDKLLLPETARVGYVFSGWYNVPGGAASNGGRYAEEYFLESGDITLYAYWVPKQYTITLNPGAYGTLEQSTATVRYRQHYVLPVPDATNPDYAFDGWYSEPNRAGIKYTDADGDALNIWVGTSDLTLYGSWVNVIIYQKDNIGNYYKALPGPGIQRVTSVTIVAEYNGLPVEEIGSFQGRANLVTINIPDTITTIVTNAFLNCTGLTAVNVYETEGNHDRLYSSADGMLIYHNVYLGKQLDFVPATRTGSLRIPDGVEVLPNTIFKKSIFTEFIIPASVTLIDVQAFESSKSLTSVVFLPVPEDEEAQPLTISIKAFYDCIALTSISLPARMTNMDIEAFAGCNNLTAIHIEGTGGRYTSENGVLCVTDETVSDTIVYAPRGISGSYTIPETVLYIGNSAFKDCKNINELIIPGKVERIGKEAFRNCTALLSIDFQGTNQQRALEIEESAFYGCSSLTEVTLPGNLTKMAQYAFGGITKLTSVIVLSGGITDGNETMPLDFAHRAFSYIGGSSYVTYLYLGEHVTALEIAGVFGGSRLAEVEVHPQNSYYAAQDGVLYDKEVQKILYYPLGRLGNFDIPATVTEIGDSVFYGNTNITRVFISKSVTKIADQAFRGANRLTEIIFEPGGTQDLVIGDNAFHSCTGLTSIILPDRLTTIGADAFRSCSNLTQMTIPHLVTKIGAGAFASCTKLESINLPASLDTLGVTVADVFTGCTVLSAINVAENNAEFASYDGILYKKANDVATELILCPSGKSGVVDIISTVTMIRGGAFAGNINITEIKFSQGLDGSLTFQAEVFSGCTKLAKVTLPAGVTNISERMFNGCRELREIIIPRTVSSMGSAAFYGCSNLVTVTFEADYSAERVDLVLENGANLNAGVFGSIDKLAYIELPERTTEVGDFAFHGMTGLLTVKLPSTLERLGRSVFESSSNLDSVIFAEGIKITKIPDYAFQRTRLRQNFVLPEGITEIGINAFAYTDFVTIEIPSSVTIIGKDAFYYADFLQTVTFAGSGGDDLVIGERAFSTIRTFQSVVLPARLTEIHAKAFANNAIMTSVTFAEGSRLQLIQSSAFESSAMTEFAFPESSVESLTFGRRLFANSRFLTDIYLSKSVTTVDSTIVGEVGGVFDLCGSIATVEVHPDNPNLAAHPELPLLLNKDASGNPTAIRYTFGLLEGVEYGGKQDVLIVEDGYTEIGDRVFENQPFKWAILPASLKRIGDFAFAGCNDLQGVMFLDFENSQLEYIGMNAFDGCSSLTEFKIPALVKVLNQYAFRGCSSLSNLELPNGFESIGYYALSGTTSLETLNIPSSVHGLGRFAFSNSGIKNVTLHELVFIPDPGSANRGPLGLMDGEGAFGNTPLATVTFTGSTLELSRNMFQNTSQLTSVTLSEGLQVIGERTFYNSAITQITIPSTVTDIKNNAFQNSAIASITIPAGVEKLGTSATASAGGSVFMGCASLTTVQFAPNSSLNLIGYATFRDCTALTSIDIPGGEIGNYAFAGSGITDLDIPASVTKIGSYAFQGSALQEVDIPNTTFADNAFAGCASLNTVTLDGDIKILGNYMFDGAAALMQVTLPKNLERMGTYTFRNSGLTSITIPEKVLEFGGATGTAALSTASYVFYGCVNLEEVTLHENFQRIGTYAFYGCTSLTSIDLSSVTRIGNNAFQKSGLTSVDISHISSVSNLGTYIFDDCAQLSDVTLNDNLTTLPFYMFRNTPSLTSITLPSKLTTFGTSTFENSGLTSISIPAGVTAVGASATATAGGSVFKGSANLTEVIFEVDDVTEKSKVTLIGYGAFQNTGLTQILIPDTVTQLGNYAFAGCTSLTGTTLTIDPETGDEVASLSLPKVTSISNYTFQNCASLTSLDLPLVKTIGNYAFQNCTALTEVYLPSATHIGAITSATATTATHVFAGSTSLTTVNLPEAIFVGNNAFDSCTSLTTVNLPKATSVGTGGATTNVRVFKDCTSLVSITLPVATVIGKEAFVGATALTSIILPEVTEVRASAFMGLTALTTISMPKVTTIAANALEDLTALESVDISGIETIGNYAFRNTISLQSINLPDSLTSIGSYAFANSGLIEVTLPAALDTYGYAAFGAASNLTAIWVHGSNPHFTADSEGILYTADMGLVCYPAGKGGVVTLADGVKLLAKVPAFYGCNEITRVILPETTTAIPAEVFVGYNGLIDIDIPEGVESLGDYSFQLTTSLESITLPSTLKHIGAYAFDASSVKHLVVPEGVESIGNYAFRNSKLETIVLPSTLTSIGNYAFENCESLKLLVFPGSLQSMGTHIIKGSGVEKVVLSEGITAIGGNSLRDAASFTEIELPESLESIGTFAFAQSAVEEIVIPAAVTNIGSYAFYNSPLKSFTLTSGNVTLGASIFENCTLLETVILADGLTALPNYTFRGTASLKSIVLPAGLTTIGTYVFTNSGIESIVIPGGVKNLGTAGSMGDNIFTGCASLQSVVLESGVEQIGYGVFRNLEALETVVLPGTLTAIGNYAFQNCTALTALTLPDGLVTIGNTAFGNCTALTSIVVPASVFFVDNFAFEYWTAGQTLYIKNIRFAGMRIWSSMWSTRCEAVMVWEYTGD